MKDKLLSQAKIALLTRGAIFFSTILFNLKIKWDSNIPTACIDGITLTINEQFFESLNPNQRIFLLAHETCHVALNHISRREDRDPVKYNRAGDYVINLMLVNSGYEFIPEGLLNYSYHGLTTEQVYDLLENDEQPYDCDIIEGEESNSTQIEEILIKAITASKLANETIGSITGESERILNELINPVLPYGIILQDYVNSFMANDYSYRKPNRRYTDVILPSLYSETIDNIYVFFDASGSVTNEDFQSYISELSGLREQCNPKQLHIFSFDTQITAHHVLEEYDAILDISFKGFGGTQIDCVLNVIEEDCPFLSIIFTDGEFYLTPFTENSNIIWIIYNNSSFKSEFGKIIHFN